jgi:YHS domain-containing protein
MEVDPEKAATKTESQGQTYYCAPGCKAASEKEPEKYLEPDADGEEHHHHAH